MYFVLAHIDNNVNSKRYLLPKINEQCEDWVEIKIDEESGEFIAKKIKGKFEQNKDWKIYRDSTFATPLFSHFLSGDK
jgi:hypothetical protein